MVERYKIAINQDNGEFVYYTNYYDEDNVFINFISNDYFHRVNKKNIVKIVDRKR